MLNVESIPKIETEPIKISSVSPNSALNMYAECPRSIKTHVIVVILKTGHAYKVPIRFPAIWKEGQRSKQLLALFVEMLPQYEITIVGIDDMYGIGLL